MKKNHKKGIIISIILIGVISIIVCLQQWTKYRKSDTYRYKQKGYSEEEIQILKANIKNTEKIWEEKYNENIPKFSKQKYFIEKNLKQYISYSKENPTAKIKEIITIVNTQTYKIPYEEVSKADTTKEELILVNKYYYLEENFPGEEQLITISPKYAYANIKIRKEIYEEYKNMWEGAKEEGITLIASAGYRSYEKQKKAYDFYSDTKGENYAEKMVAKPGFSETQTGLAINLTARGTTKADFANSEAYKWLQENAAEYGFILRYPKEKEDITLFPFDPCHWRYVGKKAAKIIQKENISLEEYYTYYLNK